MPTTPISPFTPAAAPRTDRAVTGLGSADFFKLLVTELRQQDPLQPTKTADMIGQVSQIRNIELSQQLTDTLAQLSRQQRTTAAGDLLGKHVTAALTNEDGDDEVVGGVVTGIRFDSDGGAVLELDSGRAVPAASVTRISATAANAASPAGAAEPGVDKSAAASQDSEGGLFPWLSLDGSIHL